MSPPGPAGPSRHLLQIAPMMEVTYRDFRFFMRLLTRRAQLWTEMVVDDTLLHNLEPEKCERFLGYDPLEHPIVCQLGGSDPVKLAEAAQVVERYGYDEVNLNVGCPSCRVAQKGEFGCSLMLRKEVVRDIIHAMSRAVQIPVTVKCRLGCDDHDSPEFTRDFVRAVAQGGCKHFIIHARKALLQGLSPAANRSVPPLHYDRVLDLCREFPDLVFSLNGGVNDVSHARALLGLPGQRLDGESEALVPAAWGLPETEQLVSLPSNLQGVMIGRGAMNTPCMLWDADRALYGEPDEALPLGATPTRRSLLDAYRKYLEERHPPEEATDKSVGIVHQAVKPTLGLFAGLRGNRAFRGTLDTVMRDRKRRNEGPAACIEEAMRAVEAANPGVLDEMLSATQAYHPGKQGAAASGGDGKTGSASTGGEPRGRKRKMAAEVPPTTHTATKMQMPSNAPPATPVAKGAAAQSEEPQPPAAVPV